MRAAWYERNGVASQVLRVGERPDPVPAADQLIDHRAEPVAERVRELTGGRGADAVIDMDFQSTASLIGRGVLRPRGRIVSYGSDPATETPLDFRTMLWHSLSLLCFLVDELQPADRAAVIAEANELLQRRALAHRIAHTFPLERVAQAHEAVEEGRRIGVVLVQPA